MSDGFRRHARSRSRGSVRPRADGHRGRRRRRPGPLIDRACSRAHGALRPLGTCQPVSVELFLPSSALSAVRSAQEEADRERAFALVDQLQDAIDEATPQMAAVASEDGARTIAAGILLIRANTFLREVRAENGRTSRRSVSALRSKPPSLVDSYSCMTTVVTSSTAATTTVFARTESSPTCRAYLPPVQSSSLPILSSLMRSAPATSSASPGGLTPTMASRPPRRTLLRRATSLSISSSPTPGLMPACRP